MLLNDNFKYRDWEILFERYLKLLGDNVILMNRSLGGLFIAKYLSENVFPVKILSFYLTAPVFTQNIFEGFGLRGGLSLIEKNCKNVTLMFSEDYEVVPIKAANEYKKDLVILEL